MARHTRKVGKTVRRVASALGLLVFGAGLWLAPPANADENENANELVQLALLDLDKLKALSDSELGMTRGLGGEAPGVDAAISNQVAVILWDETKRHGTTNTRSTGSGISVSVTAVEN